MWRPMSVRNEVFQALYEELLSAKSSGLPVAGAAFPVLAVGLLADKQSSTKRCMPYDTETRPCMQSHLVLRAGACASL